MADEREKPEQSKPAAQQERPEKPTDDKSWPPKGMEVKTPQVETK